MRAGKYPWPEGEPFVPPAGGQVASPVTKPNAPPLGPNHSLVRVRRHHQAIVLDVSECSVHLSPSEALRLIADLEALCVPMGWLEPR
jgi:hypothetical protein